MAKNKFNRISVKVEVDGKIVPYVQKLAQPVEYTTLSQVEYKAATEMLYNVLLKATKKADIAEAFKTLKTINGHEVDHQYDFTGYEGLPIFNELAVNAMFGKAWGQTESCFEEETDMKIAGDTTHQDI